MTDQRQQGPRSLHLWIEDNGKLAGLEWHCPPGQCRDHQDAVCPHAQIKDGTLLCDDVQHCKEAMRLWAEETFAGFAKLFRERA